MLSTCLVGMTLLSCTQQEEQKQPDNSIKHENALFTLTDPQETGLYFINEVKETEQLNILTYEYLYNGGGVAIGDVNQDGLEDVFLSGNLFGGRLFLNKGDLKFEQISETAGVFVPGWSTGVAMIDINEDGYDDIYICRSLALQPALRTNVLLINNQDNTFTDKAAEYGLADQSFSHHVNFFDYDNDGDLDMYLLNHRIDFKEALTLRPYINSQGIKRTYKDAEYEFVSDRLYRNNGDQTFTDVTKSAGLLNRAFGLSVTTADINKDGWTDIYVANDYADKDYFYINNGDGTFTDQLDTMFSHFSKNAMGADIADFNNDGLLDLINLDMMAEHNYRQKQLKGQSPYDLYHTAVDYGLGHQVMHNSLQLNNGNGTFSEIAQLAGVSHTDWSWSPLLADFDNDGFKDLFITNGYYRDVTDMDYLNYKSAEAVRKFGGQIAGNTLALIQLMNSTPVSNYLYQNKGDLTFADKSMAWGIDQPAFSNGAVYADLDQDGDLDLVTNNLNSEAFLYRNNSQEQGLGNYLSIALHGKKGNPTAIGAKVNVKTSSSDQFQEVSPYRGYFSSTQSQLHFGLGKETAATISVVWPNGQYTLLENIEVNQKLDINIKDAASQKPSEKSTKQAWLQKVTNGITQDYRHTEDDFIDFKREPLLEHQLSNKGPFITKGDVNGDGLEDIYIGASASVSGTLYIQGNNATFTKKKVPAFTKDTSFEDGQALFLDVDGDEDLDLFVASGGYGFSKNARLYQNRLYKNDGQGNFVNATSSLPPTLENSTAVVSLDFDKDGDLDLFIAGGTLPGAYPMAAKSQLLLNDKGSFSDASEKLPENGDLGMINDALWIDYDGDGKAELILAGEWMPIQVLKFENSKFQFLDVPGLEQSAGWWNVIRAADMDGDGDLDLIAGNRGENNFYKAPAEIYAKDFDGNGQIDAFPFYPFSDGKFYPKHTLMEVAKQYPEIRKKFNRYAPYSNARISDMFTQAELKGAIKLTVDTFSSTYFENSGDGSFKMKALPPQAQLSEVHGVLLLDVNEDGHPDMLLTGNNYGADVEAGQSDASIGLVLSGNGKGDFSALSTSESGFYVPGDARGMTQIGNSILVMVNNGKPYAFQRNQ